MRYYPLDEELHRTAHDMNSFWEYRSDEPGYKADVDEVYQLADAAAERDPESTDEAYRLADRYAYKLAEWLNRKYAIDARCPSVMVAGPANFPMRKKEKQNRARDHLWEEYCKVEAIKEKIEHIGTFEKPIMSGDADAIDKLKAKLEKLEADHQQMKDENAKARKEGREAPHPRYRIANSYQNITATRKRLESLEAAKDRGSQESTVTILDEEARVVENTEIMRLQLIFDGKPSDEVRALLKKQGFRWSPKNTAWQRQLTDNARYALQALKSA